MRWCRCITYRRKPVGAASSCFAHVWPHIDNVLLGMKSADCKLIRQRKNDLRASGIQPEAAAEMVANCQPHCPRLGLRRCLLWSQRGIVEVFSSFLAVGTCTVGSVVDKPLEVKLDTKWTGRPLDPLHAPRCPSLVVGLTEMNAFVAKVDEHTIDEVPNRGGFSSVLPPDPCLPVYNVILSVRHSHERTHNGGRVKEMRTHRVSGSPGISAGTDRWLSGKGPGLLPLCPGEKTGNAHFGI